VTRSLADLDWPVRTERLLIRPALVRDAEATFAYRRIEEVSQWMTSLPDDEEKHARSFVAGIDSTLVVERDDKVVGDLYLSVGDAWSQGEVKERAAGVQAEIGWCLDPAYQGQGYALEASAALLRIAFEGLALRRVYALCFAANEPSWRLMERLGMRREEHNIRDSLHRSGEWMDGLGYALLAEEWQG
jgi:RimJ/RimL family protein N-acetyltransferase